MIAALLQVAPLVLKAFPDLETTLELPRYRHLSTVPARVHVLVRVTYATTASMDGSVHRLSLPRCQLPAGTDGHAITALAGGFASRRQLPLPRALPETRS